MNQSTKKPLFATVVLSLSLAVSVGIAHAKGEAEADVVVATVNGDKIMKSSLDGYLKVIKRSPNGASVKTEEALDDLVATELALQEAKKTDILTRTEVKKKIADFTRNVVLTTWTKEKVKSFTIADAEIKAEYDETVKKLASKEFNARHILLKTEDEAKSVIKEISEGADFAKVAKEKSTGPSASNGGSLGWFKAQTMVPTFATAVKAMKKGDVSKEAVKTQFGWHVIKLEDSRDAKLPTLDALKSKITRKLSQKKMLAYMDKIKETADVKITLPKEKKVEKKEVEKEEAAVIEKKEVIPVEKKAD
ncbi:MAG: peptidylprolyl isomerase, partial [Cocleimonas sp.]|nr:peptidylprolyl isomerase [Cocleimonas sp.]